MPKKMTIDIPNSRRAQGARAADMAKQATGLWADGFSFEQIKIKLGLSSRSMAQYYVRRGQEKKSTG